LCRYCFPLNSFLNHSFTWSLRRWSEVLFLFRRELLGHQVERRSGLKPFDLTCIVRMVDNYFVSCTITVMKDECQRLIRCERSQSNNIDNIIFMDLVVIFLIRERKREHTLLLEVCFVDTCER